MVGARPSTGMGEGDEDASPKPRKEWAAGEGGWGGRGASYECRSIHVHDDESAVVGGLDVCVLRGGEVDEGCEEALGSREEDGTAIALTQLKTTWRAHNE